MCRSTCCPMLCRSVLAVEVSAGTCRTARVSPYHCAHTINQSIHHSLCHITQMKECQHLHSCESALAVELCERWMSITCPLLSENMKREVFGRHMADVWLLFMRCGDNVHMCHCRCQAGVTPAHELLGNSRPARPLPLATPAPMAHRVGIKR